MWLKLSDTARDNKKVRRLAAALGVSYPEALGHLALLWLWRIQDGDLTGFTAEEIAAVALWRGNATQFVEVLMLAGFIDQVDGRDMLHDHEEHQGSVKEARRKARQRAKKRDVLVGGRDQLPKGVVFETMVTGQAQVTVCVVPLVPSQPTGDSICFVRAELHAGVREFTASGGQSPLVVGRNGNDVVDARKRSQRLRGS